MNYNENAKRLNKAVRAYGTSIKDILNKEVVNCKYCREKEYYMNMRWLNGKQMCRDCYKNEYENTTGELYEWDDLEGDRPE